MKKTKISDWQDRDLTISLQHAEDLLSTIPACDFADSLEIFVGELWDEIVRREELQEVGDIDGN